MDLFYYNAQYQVLICRGRLHGALGLRKPADDVIEHQAAVAPAALDNHLYRAHSMAHCDRKQLGKQIGATYELAAPRAVKKPPASTDPIAGLKIHPAFLCILDDCDQGPGHLSLHISKVQWHRGRCHRVHHQGAEAGIRRVYAQTFFTEKRFLQYFAVGQKQKGAQLVGQPTSASGPVDGGPIGWALAGASFEASQKAWTDGFDDIPEPQHASQETPWMKRTGFAVHLRGYSKASLLRATASPGRVAATCPESSGEQSENSGADSGPSMLQEPGSMARLSVMLSRVGEACNTLLEKAHRAASQSGPDARLSTGHAMVLNTLEANRMQSEPFRQLQEHSTLRRYSNNWARFLAYIWRLYQGEMVEELGGLLELTSRQRNMLNSMAIVASQQPGSTDAIPSGMWFNELEESVLAVSISFVEQELPESRYSSGLLSYVAARALKRDGSWKEPQYMTSLMASITYIMQLLIFATTRQEADAAGGPRFAARLRDRCGRWLVNNQESPSSEILSLRLYAGKVASATLPTAYTSWSLDGQTVTYKASVMTMTDWRGLIREQVERARDMLQQRLFFGRMNRPYPRAHDLSDVETETRPGYSFTQDPRNGLSSQARWLLNTLLKEPDVENSLIQIRDGSIVWVAGRVSRYLKDVGAFLEHLLLAMHLTGGLPGRAPEILSLRHCNDEQPRNIMIHDGQVMFITGYHKMMYAAGSRLVCRFLPAVVGDMVVTYLSMVLPFARHLETIQGRRPARSFLFEGGRGLWKDERLGEILKRESRAILGTELMVSAYRHLAIAIDRRHLRGLGVQTQGLREDGETEGGKSDDVVNDLQASHSTWTSNMNYANSVRTGRMFNDPQLHQFRQTSMQWHELAHLSSRAPSGLTKRGRTDSMQGSVQQRGPRLQATWTTAAEERQTRRRTWTEDEIDEAMRRIHGQGAVPRSEGQWMVLSRMGEDVTQLVVVLPTGGGKSLLFQAPSVLSGAGVTVVILPLVALRQDLKAKCKALGLSYTHWDAELDMDSACAPLLLVGVEDACRATFLGLLQRLNLQGRLDRVFLDEAQMVLTDAHYREALRLVRQVRRVHVPFVALTATLPPSQEASLCEALFLERPLIIRRSVDRPNLGYVVVGPEAVIREWGDRLPPRPTLLDMAVMMIQLMRLERDERMLVYAPTKAMVSELAKLVGCPAYHADISERDAVLRAWVQGETRVLIGTNAIGAGVDYPSVRTVLHVGAPRSAVAYGQESGRAGRDGVASQSVVLLERPARTGRLQGGSQAADQLAMQRMLQADVRCRRQILTAYLDGGQGLTCEAVAGSILCDACCDFDECAKKGESSPREARALDDVEAGERLARAAMRLEERGRSQHRERLEYWTSAACLQCYLAGNGQAWGHKPCPTTFREHKTMEAGRKELRLTPHVGCFHCGSPEWLCPSNGKRGECLWRSGMIELCFLCHQARLHPRMMAVREAILPPEARGPRCVTFFQWAGGVTLLHGAKAFRLNVFADRLLEELPVED